MDYRNHFLFSETYLNDVLGKMKKDEIQEYDTIFDNIYSWYQEYKDAWTLFEDIVLDTLGFEKVPEGLFRMLRADMGKVPVIAYMLDKECDLNSTVKGKYYAVDAVQYAKKKDINWAIVTNGIRWRLYNTISVSPYEFYFETDLSEALETGRADAATRAFGRMFSAIAYKQDVNSSVCQMDSFNEASHSAEENIEDVLRSKAESILKGLCYGLKENMCLSVFDDKQRKQIYDDSIVLLYRLLFLGYAEARNLLPVVKDDPDYQDSFSALCRDARDYYVSGNLNAVGDAFDLWTRLDSQLRIYVDKNYNGGLFSNEDKPVLREYRIANRHLAICLMELAYVSGKKKDYLQKIEYKDLSVRNLGAIYEGLLEYQLFIADELMVQRKAKEKVSYIKASETRLTNSDKNNLVQPGEIYLSQDALERKETGAYYTPEDVVEYIVKNTVGEKLAELKKELDEELAELRDELSYEPVEQNRQMIQREIDEKTVEFINDKILSLSIIDSAMGSGHFLVNAAYQVANFVVDLLETNCWENGEINADVTYWKRRVVENCIYGIDINSLSVLLARLSLWLISASNDKALSFIDHHLKCGNSLMGTTLNKVQYFDEDIPILSVTKDQYIYPVLKKYNRIKTIGSDTKESVRLQHSIYDEILEDLKVVRKKMDYYLACQYIGQIIDSVEYRSVLLADSMHFFENEDFSEIFKIADKNQFFHWEIEFPEVYMAGGFDLLIGNPPYGANLSEKNKEFFKLIYENVHMRTPDTFNYFIAKAFDFLKDDGEVSFIVPSNLLFQNEYEKTRKFLLSEHKLKHVVNAGDNVFEHASVPTCVFIACKTPVEDSEISYADKRDGYKKSSEWNKGMIQIKAKSILETPGCVIGVAEESVNILKKVKDNSCLIDDIADDVAAGISSGGNEAFCVSKEDIEREQLEDQLLFKMLGGRNIDSYKIMWENQYIIYSTKNSDTPKYPNIYRRLLQFEEKLSKKRETKKGVLPWWSLHWPRTPDLFMGKKIIMRQTSDRIRATIDSENFYILNSSLILKLKDGSNYSYEFVLGILNSSLNNFIYRNLTQEKGRAFAEVKPKNVRKLYVPKMKSEQIKIIENCVEELLNDISVKSNLDIIDSTIYSFYGLDEDEIGIIEKEVK